MLSEDLSKKKALEECLIREAWERGILSYKLHAGQLKIHDKIRSSRGTFVMEIARQWGKTFLNAVIAIEDAILNPGGRIAYGAPTLKMLEEFIRPTFDAILSDCPEYLRPKFNSKNGHLKFPNGSWIHLFGADNLLTAKRGRGPPAVRCIFDEGGFCAVLETVVKDVFRHTLQHSGGDILLASSPSDLPEHYFTRQAEIAEAVGNYARQTIYDNPRLSPERIQSIIEVSASDSGMSVEEYKVSPPFRRELLAERVVDSQSVVMGDDWQNKRLECIREIPIPEYFDAYTCLDFGGVDPHAALFGYLDFRTQTLVVLDELLLRGGENTKEIAELIESKEKWLYGESKFAGTPLGLQDKQHQELPDWLKKDLVFKKDTQPYVRFCDNDPQLAKDLYQLHKLAFIPVSRKDEKRLMVNELRIMVRTGRLVVHPRCVNLDRQLRGTRWQNYLQRGYTRINGEHGDLVDALIYMSRNIQWQKNPWPDLNGFDPQEVYVRKVAQQSTGWENMFVKR